MTCLSKNPDLWGNKSVFQKRIFVLRALLNGAQAELNWGILAEKQAAVILYLKTALVAGKSVHSSSGHVKFWCVKIPNALMITRFFWIFKKPTGSGKYTIAYIF